MAGTIRGRGKETKASEVTDQGTPTATSLTEYTEFKKALAKSPALITGYAKLLKAAGYYKGAITDKYTPKFQKALDAAEDARLSISAIRPVGRDEFLSEQIDLGGVGGEGKAGTRTQTYIANDSDIEALINRIYQAKTGYKATAKEMAEEKKYLRRQEQLNPIVQKYDASGNLIQTGGVNEEQLLTKRVEQTGAAEKTRAEVANQLMLKELGGLQ
jgi:hypothetical protein